MQFNQGTWFSFIQIYNFRNTISVQKKNKVLKLQFLGFELQ